MYQEHSFVASFYKIEKIEKEKIDYQNTYILIQIVLPLEIFTYQPNATLKIWHVLHQGVRFWFGLFYGIST